MSEWANFIREQSLIQQDMLKQLDPKQDGKYANAVNGHTAQRTQDGARDLDSAKPVERFASAITVIDSVDSINFATPASTLLFAERFHQALDRAELPEGVFQHLVLDPRQTAEISAGG